MLPNYFSPSYVLSLSETYMIPSVVKEASGLYTIKSSLFMQPTKADKDSKFQCIVEYEMPKREIKQKMSDIINITLYCEWRRGTISGTIVNKCKGFFHTCSMSVYVHPDPSEKATFALRSTPPFKEGDNITMKCETDGNPQPGFEFTKEVGISCVYMIII